MVEGLRPCPTCGAPVAPGRLSCPSCGTLLASVSGRAETPAADGSGPPATSSPLLAPAGEPVSVAAEPVPSEAGPLPPEPTMIRPADPSRPAPSVLHPLNPSPGDWPVAWRASAGTPLPAYTSIPSGTAGDRELATNQWYSMRSAQQAAVAASPAPAAAVAASGEAAMGTARPAEPTPATAGLLSDLPFRAPSTMAAWVAALGAFIAGVSVILPWRATPGLPYLTIWGAAMPSVVVAAIVALVTGLIAITPSRLAPRVRWGFVPFFVGAFGVGAAWMWQSLYAADIGLWVYVGGSIVAAGGGALSLSGWAEPTSR